MENQEVSLMSAAKIKKWVEPSVELISKDTVESGIYAGVEAAHLPESLPAVS